LEWSGEEAGIMRETVAAKIEEIAERIASSAGLELVEVEVKGGGNARLVRITIDRAEGISHADCSLVSEQVGGELESGDVVPGHYTLEVSSPGLERKLIKPKDYLQFQGRKAEISLREAVEGRLKWQGTLAGLAEGVVSLTTEPGVTRRIPLDLVSKAHLKFEW